MKTRNVDATRTPPRADPEPSRIGGATVASSISPVRSRTRRVAHLTKGHTHGPITRLMSPGDLGELVKPFVFLDYFET